MSRTLLKRAVAAATTLGLVGAATLALAPAAGAAEAGGITATPKADFVVVNGTTEAPAGDIWFTASKAIESGDTITLQVAPPTGSDCATDNHKNVWFDSTPKVSFPAGTGRIELALGRTAGCTVDNLVILKAAGPAPVPAGVVKLSGITYAVGRDAQVGPVRLGVAGTPVAGTNAHVARVGRVAGADRYATAEELYGMCTSAANRVEHVVVVNGINFPDALAASYLGLPDPPRAARRRARRHRAGARGPRGFEGHRRRRHPGRHLRRVQHDQQHQRR